MKRFEVWIVGFDPVVGSEVGKARPAVIVSPDEANASLRTVLVAPLTSVRRRWPSRVPVRLRGVPGDVALDQLRAVDKQRLVERIGVLSRPEREAVAARLVEMLRL